MNGFRTARAVVLDNDPNEAAPVIQALGSLGVGVLFHTGDDLDRRPMRHKGVRLLVSDMVLENRGASYDDPKMCASILAGTLGSLIEDDHHPIVVVCWTKHKEIKEEFEKAFRKTFPKLQLVAVILFEKEKLLSDGGDLLRQVQEAMNVTEPFAFLLAWEQQVHNATTDTSSEISRLISEKRGADETWSMLAYKICASLAVANRGLRVACEDSNTAAAALFGALNPLLSDRLEVHCELVARAGLDHSPRILDAVKTEVESLMNGKPKGSLLSRPIRSALNSMLHVARCEHGVDVLPGTIWVLPNQGKVRESMCSSLPSLDWQRLREGTLSNALTIEPVPILVEVTPPCDFAQDKAAVSRLVPGYLVNEMAGKVQSAGYLWMLGPLSMPVCEYFPAGDYRLVLNSKYFCSVCRADSKKWKPLCRLRQSALANLTAFTASHIGRVGFMRIEP